MVRLCLVAQPGHCGSVVCGHEMTAHRNPISVFRSLSLSVPRLESKGRGMRDAERAQRGDAIGALIAGPPIDVPRNGILNRLNAPVRIPSGAQRPARDSVSRRAEHSDVLYPGSRPRRTEVHARCQCIRLAVATIECDRTCDALLWGRRMRE